MTALIAILWALWLLVSVNVVFELVGCRGLVQMFPEGKRWWMLPSQLLALCNFAACVLLNPF
uniref:Uncharacterized protein n=1 Tax=Salmonella phage vB_SEnST11_KE23 TaxID=3161174 RepID=A0AAU8GIL8_9CAUD